jgi:mitogen-activated protein kinase organizer 1
MLCDRVYVYSAPDNSRFISASADKSLLLWDVASGKTIRKFRAHSGPINAVKLNEEATMAVSASYDASVKCWDLRSNDRDPVQVMNEAKDRYFF